MPTPNGSIPWNTGTGFGLVGCVLYIYYRDRGRAVEMEAAL